MTSLFLSLSLCTAMNFYALLEITMHQLAEGTGDVQSLSNVRDYLYKNWQSDGGTDSESGSEEQ